MHSHQRSFSNLCHRSIDRCGSIQTVFITFGAIRSGRIESRLTLSISSPRSEEISPESALRRYRLSPLSLSPFLPSSLLLLALATHHITPSHFRLKLSSATHQLTSPQLLTPFPPPPSTSFTFTAQRSPKLSVHLVIDDIHSFGFFHWTATCFLPPFPSPCCIDCSFFLNLTQEYSAGNF